MNKTQMATKLGIKIIKEGVSSVLLTAGVSAVLIMMKNVTKPDADLTDNITFKELI